MNTKILALMLTLITGAATAGQDSSPRVELYGVCDVQLHDAYGRVVADEQQTVTREEANRLGEQSTQPALALSHKEIADAQD